MLRGWDMGGLMEDYDGKLKRRWTALTSALSPRRGSTMRATGFVTFFAAFIANTALNAARDWKRSRAFSALPLLGERAGVRADFPFGTHEHRRDYFA